MKSTMNITYFEAPPFPRQSLNYRKRALIDISANNVDVTPLRKQGKNQDKTDSASNLSDNKRENSTPNIQKTKGTSRIKLTTTATSKADHTTTTTVNKKGDSTTDSTDGSSHSVTDTATEKEGASVTTAEKTTTTSAKTTSSRTTEPPTSKRLKTTKDDESTTTKWRTTTPVENHRYPTSTSNLGMINISLLSRDTNIFIHISFKIRNNEIKACNRIFD